MAGEHKPNKPATRSFSDLLFPARPEQLLSRARSLAYAQINLAQALAHRLGPPIAINPTYIKWLEKESMLGNAQKQALRYSGTGVMWQNPYAKARPRTAVKKASVWFTAYPISTITEDDETILATLGQDALWRAFQKIGIHGLHTGPMKRAGGLNGWVQTPSIDGHFDRISARIDDMFGTEAEFRRMCATAARHKGIVIDDIIPGHTGKGADFRLAEMNYDNYPGIYHMVEIDEEDWDMLPSVPKGHDSVNIDANTEAALKKAGYIIGKLQRVIFFEPGVKETNWSATKAVRGVDGVKRRWVYLHYFKDGQPTINWLDPSFAGIRLVVGDALHSIGDLGSTGLRLDANGFLGVEVNEDDGPAWSEGHPLSQAANQMIAGTVRKLGGFTFQELNLSMDHIKAMGGEGPDLSYDFINRPAYHHALASEDTEFLRLCLRTSLAYGIDPASLVHALQNHDELTMELVHFLTLHKDDIYEFRGQQITGTGVRDAVRKDLADKLLPEGGKLNMWSFGHDGISCTTASLIASSLGYRAPEELDETAVKRIQRAHLLLAQFNALQPGVFALSGWDLSGALTLQPEQVADLISGGDTRWINRGSYDLMGSNFEADASNSGMPKARSLYGTLPQQLSDPDSFARQLQSMLSMREKYGIATAQQIDIPNVPHKSLLVMVHQLNGGDDSPSRGNLQVTVLNFADDRVEGSIGSQHLHPGAQVMDMMTDDALGTVNEKHHFHVSLGAHEGRAFLIKK